jgi:hypothetical protein
VVLALKAKTAAETSPVRRLGTVSRVVGGLVVIGRVRVVPRWIRFEDTASTGVGRAGLGLRVRGSVVAYGVRVYLGYSKRRERGVQRKKQSGNVDCCAIEGRSLWWTWVIDFVDVSVEMETSE